MVAKTSPHAYHTIGVTRMVRTFLIGPLDPCNFFLNGCFDSACVF